MFFSIMDIHNLEYPYQSFSSNINIKPLYHPVTIMKGLIGFAQQDVSLNDLQTMKYCIKELTEFIDSYTTNYLTHGKSEKLYCFYLTKQQEREHKYIINKKRFIYLLKSHNTQNPIENFSHRSISNTQN